MRSFRCSYVFFLIISDGLCCCSSLEYNFFFFFNIVVWVRVLETFNAFNTRKQLQWDIVWTWPAVCCNLIYNVYFIYLHSREKKNYSYRFSFYLSLPCCVYLFFILFFVFFECCVANSDSYYFLYLFFIYLRILTSDFFTARWVSGKGDRCCATCRARVTLLSPVQVWDSLISGVTLPTLDKLSFYPRFFFSNLFFIFIYFSLHRQVLVLNFFFSLVSDNLHLEATTCDHFDLVTPEKLFFS